MDRTRRSGPLGAAAERFDLPADVLAGEPRIELVGRRDLYLERHGGLLSYAPERIEAATPAGTLRVEGMGLSLTAMTPEALRIGGTILSVSWGDGPC